jgi:hypothetical protein
MTSIFTLDNFNDFSEKINIDELYDKKKQNDLNKLNLFNKILNRIHIRIKNKSKLNCNEQFIWYLVPEIILGIPNYDNASCIAYLIDRLKTSGFYVKYYHPNLIFISWINWIPSYVRNEFKKKTGISIDEHGIKITDDEENENNFNNNNISNNPNDYLIKQKQDNNINSLNKKNKKEYTPINSYKPSGNLLYNDKLLSTIQEKFNN